jgi:hypothetical protein
MRAAVLVLIAATWLVGCAAPTVYYAAGVDLATRAADLSECEALATREYPVRAQTRFTPRLYVPAHRVCRADGTCTTTAGYFEGGEPYTVDANADLRRNAVRGCMGARGYARISLPICAPETRVRLSTVMPPLTEDTCLYRTTGSGPAMIINPP